MAHNIDTHHTVAIVGHSKSGKTTLTDGILYKTGLNNRFGDVDAGSSLADFLEEEQERHMSIKSSIFSLKRKEHSITLIDTPGYMDFAGDAVTSIFAADLGLVTISATAGIQVNTRMVWQQLVNLGIPRAVVVTKTDGENVDLDELLSKIKAGLGDNCIPFNYPDATGSGLSSVTCVLDKDAAGAAASGRDAFIEAAVVSDDALTEKYLEGEELSDDELGTAVRAAMASGDLIPILFIGSKKEVGFTELLDFVVSFGPNPVNAVRRACKRGEESAEYEVKADAPLLATVFKVHTDPYQGKVAYFRVLAGTLKPGASIHSTSGRKAETVGQLLSIQGAELKECGSAGPGEIVAVPKLDSFAIGDTACSETGLVLDPIDLPLPLVGLAVTPKKSGDEGKISHALAVLTDEDTTFKVERSAETGELVMFGLGTLHLEVMISEMNRRFNLEVETRTPRIPYRETITGKAEAKYRHKKQSGGAGQFAEVWMRLEPRERGEGYEFASEVFGGHISRSFIPSINKGIQPVLKVGPLAGYPVVDVKAIIYDGKEHPVDSKDVAFQIAGRECFKQMFCDAKPVLLEPVVNIEVTIPSQHMGDVNGDLNGRRARVTGMEAFGDMQVIKASVPMAEIANYSNELRSMTGGEGTYTIVPSHYDVVPGHMAESVIAKMKEDAEDH